MSGIDWPADVRAAILESVNAGNVVVAPRVAQTSGGRNRWAWWQIDPSTGETLGIDDQGRGPATVEEGVVTSNSLWIASAIGCITGSLAYIAA